MASETDRFEIEQGSGTHDNPTTPASGRPVRNRLSFASQAWDRGNKGWLDEAERLGRKYDKNNDGKIEKSEMFNIVEDVLAAQRRNSSLKNYLGIAVLLVVLLVAAMFGLTYAVVALTKEVEVKDGQLMSTKSGEDVATAIHGVSVSFTPHNSIRRKLLLPEGHEDRFLEAGEVVGWVDNEHAGNAWIAGKKAGKVTVNYIDAKTNVESAVEIGGSAEATKDKGYTTYRKVYLSGHDPSITFTVVCPPNKNERCEVTSDTRRSLMSEWCFSGDVTVVTRNNGEVPMKDLRVGEEVLTEGGKFEAIYAIPVLHATVKTSFVKLYTKSGFALELTPDHLIFIHGKKNPITAYAVKVGDELITKTGEPTVVTKISKITAEGVYNPLTPSGKIIAGGLLASTYPAPANTGPEYFSFGGIDWISHHTLTHATFVQFYQVHCRIFMPGQCVNPPRDEDGNADVATAGKAYVKFFNRGNILAKVVFSVILVPAALITGLACTLILWFADRPWACWSAVGVLSWVFASTAKGFEGQKKMKNP